MKRWIIRFVALFLLVCGATVLVDYRGFVGREVMISIPKGAGAKEIVSILQENKVILFPTLFRKYISEDAEYLKAGVHTFTTFMGYENTLEELKKDVPFENTVTVTIPEGFEVREIGQLLESAGIISNDSFLAACKTAYKRYTFLPSDGNVEGYLFPATYNFQVGEKADAVVNAMLDAFQNKMYTEEIVTKAESLSLTFHEALTLASIIEREAAKDEERTIISSVFHNRLKAGMRLESCATVQYILQDRKDVLSITDTKIESPYNTYLNVGLPPTPIACPGVESLHAALNPKNTTYLFFVADGSGGHTFSKTYQEHIDATHKNQ